MRDQGVVESKELWRSKGDEESRGKNLGVVGV